MKHQDKKNNIYRLKYTCSLPFLKEYMPFWIVIDFILKKKRFAEEKSSGEDFKKLFLYH